jgi:diphthamide biosynthesis methyltransferase
MAHFHRLATEALNETCVASEKYANIEHGLHSLITLDIEACPKI